MAEIRTVRTARKTHRCENESRACHRVIRPGDRYVLASLPPNSDLGNDRWWNLRSCAGCVQAHHNKSVDEAATERKRPARRRAQPARHVDPLDTVPCRQHVDEPRLHRRITTVHLPAANIPA
ncbi:hypothetical protein ACLQ25_09605 [Micromonospora sp. DT44]|uniref:hypothetical protein n=1 Tax=Micromonospora sp. DT44 TaxID=3393439 RepID=UPI003CE76F39